MQISKDIKDHYLYRSHLRKFCFSNHLLYEILSRICLRANNYHSQFAKSLFGNFKLLHINIDCFLSLVEKLCEIA